MPAPSSRKKLLITLAAPLLGVGGLELGLRLFGFRFWSPEVPVVMWNPGRDEAMNRGEDMHVPDAACLWSLKPGAPIPYGADEFVNAAGYRGPELGPKAPEVLRVALVGESTTFGMGMAYEATAAAQLQGLLEPEYEVFTAGVIGYTVQQGRARYRELVRAMEPDVVVIAFGLVNEANPAPTGETDQERIRAARWRASALGSLLGWIGDNTRIGELADWVRVERAGGLEALQEQTRAAKARRRELRDTFGEVDWPGLRRSPLDEYTECLTELVRAARDDGARVIVLQLPSNPAGWVERPVLELYRDANHAVARAEGVQFLDMPRIVAGQRPSGEPRVLQMLLAGDYWHLGPLGHKRLARALEQHILDPLAGLQDGPRAATAAAATCEKQGEAASDGE